MFIEDNKHDLSASIQSTIIRILMKKLKLAAKKYNTNQIAIAGGVSANSELRKAMLQAKDEFGWDIYIPPFEFTTDNAAMIAVTGYYKFLNNEYTDQKATPYARGGI